VPLDIFEDEIWQMSLGERAAIEGVLSVLQPRLAVEIGSMEGGSLRRIAAHASEVHSFDLHPPSMPVPDHVVLHTGDSHELLAPTLAEFAEHGRNLDFVLVDGDHSAQGVRRDIEDLLDSRALAHSVILIHDTANEEVRRGVDSVHFAAWPKVAHVELDWVPGRLFAEDGLRNELWFGLGLVLVDSSQLAYGRPSVYQQRYHPAAQLLAQARDLVLARERVPQDTESSDGDFGAARARIAVLEAELGERLLIRERAAALEAALAAAQRRLPALEAELEQTRRREEGLRAELMTLRHRQEGAQRALENITGSASWRMTEPLRSAKRRVRRRDD
jgi:hypothetical protein